MTTSPLIRALEQRVLVTDGATGSTFQAMPLDVERDYLGRENCVDVLTRSRPDIVRSLHDAFLEVGADIVFTNTFGANKLVFAEFDEELVGLTRAINREAAEIARGACDDHSTPDRPRFVFGSMGPGTKLITLGQTSWDVMLDSYAEQARGLVEGGADALLIETCQDLLQAKCAVNACLDALRENERTPDEVPIFVNVTIETTGTMLLGTEIAAALNALRMFPIASLGLNCATGPREMGEHIAYLSRHWDRRLSVVPNAGLPTMVNGQPVFPLEPIPFADELERFVREFGVNVVGGCCGTGPEHIRELVSRVGGLPAPRRAPEVQAPGCSSLYGFVEFEQDQSFLIVAERTNANGSRKFKRLLDEEDWDGLVSMAREEVRGGAHLADVCVDFVGRDGVADMTEVVSRYVRQVDVPLMIDSTEAPVIEAALRLAGGKCIVNSINLENGEKRFDEICPMLARYGAACVALTIDEDPQAGMAKTADRKVEIAARMHRLFVEKWGLDERDLFFDPLTFTICTGTEDDRRLGLETLDGIERIRARFPGCPVLLGLSNVSFGLRPPARAVLNSVFLHHARERGLSSAIVHPSKILPRHKIDDEHWDAAEWLIFDRRGADRPAGMPEGFDPLLHFIGLFPDGEDPKEATGTEQLPLDERLRRHIIDGERERLEAHLDEALEQWGPLEIINEHLLGGMKVVGELFGSGRMQLPFVLQSAEVMKKAVAHLEPHMEKIGAASGPKARIVLATVAGDVHDIGKNLVDIILTNNGFEVHNLGIKQPISTIVETAREVDADAIGMSGLLVKSVGVMEENLRELNAMGIDVPVLLGGAALTRHYAESHLRGIYEGALYYGKDAFEGLRIGDHLCEGKLEELDEEIDDRLAKREDTEAKVAAMRAREAARAEDGGDAAVAIADRSDVAADVPVPAAPFLGDRIVERVDLDELLPFVNRVALYRGQWGFKKGAMSPEEYERHTREVVDPIFDRLAMQVKEDGILQPTVVYGYWPCNADGDDLVVFAADDPEREVERFSFPRQAKRDRLCISDYFRPLASGERDIVAFHCVTVGREASRRARILFETDQYTEYLYLHGLGVETAEALAEMWHRRIREELGIAGDDGATPRDLIAGRYMGCRYSFGYPACPELADQERLFRLLRPERIGCELTEGWQIDPEQSTSAIVVHHPEAHYFNI